MDHFYVVGEIQINNGEAAAVTPIVCQTSDDAVGEFYSKMGYAYKNPRDYTLCVIFDEKGHNLEHKVMDNREEKTPVYAVFEVQGDAEGNIAFAPVSVKTGENAEALAMDTFHSAMAYAWRVQRQYTLGVVVQTDGLNKRIDIQGELPKPEPEEPDQGVPGEIPDEE